MFFVSTLVLFLYIFVNLVNVFRNIAKLFYLLLSRSVSVNININVGKDISYSYHLKRNTRHLNCDNIFNYYFIPTGLI